MRVAGPGWLRSGAAKVMAFTVAYYLLAQLSYSVSFIPGGNLAAWWAPSGLALFALVRADLRAFPWYLAGIAVAASAVNATHELSVWAVAYRSLADMAEPLAGALLVRQFAGRNLALRTMREVGIFALCGGLAGPSVGALTVMSAALVEGQSLAEAAPFVVIWFGSAALGVILFAPALLTWQSATRRPGRARTAEATLLAVALLGLAVGSLFLVGPGMGGVLVGLAAFPLLAWAAVRFGPAGAGAAALALSVLSLWPFAAATQTPQVWQAIAIQVIYALAALTALSLSALLAEADKLRNRARVHASRAEESLALLESALRNAPFPVAFFDPHLHLTRANEAFAALEPRTTPTLAGNRLEAVLPQQSASVRPVMQDVLADGLVTQVDVKTQGPPPRSWLCSAFPVADREGQVISVGLLMVDLTDRQRAEEERTRLLDRAEEAVRVREDFLSIASHELKTPLTPLAVRLSALQRKLANGEQVGPDAIEKPLQSLRKLTELINDLLDASRIEHGRLQLQREPQPVVELVRQAVEPYRGTSVRHPLVVRTPEEPLWINADRQRLAQVLTNLVDNAIKYSPEGGTVEVVVQPHPEGVEVVVSDQGIGIPADQRERLFDRFYRAANASISYGGLGLGLYITRDIVERHGGRIWSEAAPQGGSRFHVVLPLMKDAELQQTLH